MSTLVVYFVAAVAPAAALLLYIYRHDRGDKEPPRLLWKLVGFGALSALLAIVLEQIADPLIMGIWDPQTSFFGYTVVSAFIGVALMEEGAKFLLLRLGSWKEPNFNYSFDGIIYAVCVSLGFAALENIEYVFGYGLSVAPSRAVLSIPGHLSFSVVMGYFYSRARLWANWGQMRQSKANLRLGLLMATLMHGFYDCCLMLGTELSMFVFMAFVAVLFFAVFRLVKRQSRQDQPI